MKKTEFYPLISEQEMLDNLGNYKQTIESCPHCGQKLNKKTTKDYETKFRDFLNNDNCFIKLFECPLGYAFVTQTGNEGHYNWQFNWIKYENHITIN